MTSSFSSSLDPDEPSDFLSAPAEEINPANGLPMIGGLGGIDIMGNPYGTDHQWVTSGSSFSPVADSWSIGGSDPWSD